MNRYRRYKLRAHDMGIDRHNKPVAHERKAARVDAEHGRAVAAGNRRRREHVEPEPPVDAHGSGCVCEECLS